MAAELDEPSGAVLVDGDLVVVESAAHRLVRPVPTTELVTEAPQHTARPTSAVAPGAVRLDVRFVPAPGRKLDERYGPSTQLTVSASPPELSCPARARAPNCRANSSLPTTARASSRSSRRPPHATSAREHPACYLARQDWGVPIEIMRSGEARVELVLLG